MSTPSGMSATPSARRRSRDLASRGAEQAGVRCHGAAQPDHPGMDVLLAQPRAVEPVVLGGGAEVPDVGFAAPRQERVAGHLVAGPLADVGARDVADVVEIEQEQPRRASHAARAAAPGPGGRPAAGRRSTRSSQSTFADRRRDGRSGGERRRRWCGISVGSRSIFPGWLDGASLHPSRVAMGRGGELFINATHGAARAQVRLMPPTGSDASDTQPRRRRGPGRRNGAAEPEFATMGDRLRRARTARGLSLRAPGRRLGVSPSLDLPGRDGPGQAVGEHALRPCQRAWHLPRRPPVHGHPAAGRRPGSPTSVRRADPRRSRAARSRAASDARGRPSDWVPACSGSGSPPSRSGTWTSST